MVYAQVVRRASLSNLSPLAPTSDFWSPLHVHFILQWRIIVQSLPGHIVNGVKDSADCAAKGLPISLIHPLWTTQTCTPVSATDWY